ncbi:MAG: aminopeptidase P family protein [Methanomassiliicoccus sp.]|nr:aminopeptidase P family protein [Methanomassiliicoccus sp.]
MKDRVLRIFSKLSEPVDAILLVNDEEPITDASFFHATGLTSGLFEHCPAILYPDGKLRLITSRLEETSARSIQADVVPYFSAAERAEQMAASLKGVTHLGINGTGITYHWVKEIEAAAPQARLVDVGREITAARLVKDAEEIEAMREACRIASRVADSIPDLVKVGMTEYEAGAEIGYHMQRLGASGVSFETIAAFGPPSAEPHHSPGDGRLKEGDVALFDFGCKVRRYCSDITRTFFAGHADDRLLRMYAVVQEAQRLAMGAVRAGVNGREVDAAARSYIDSTEFKGSLIHSTGHSLGINVHDGGRLAPAVDMVLEENMVFTIEPGVYVPGVGGIRIEDDVVVTKRGCESLTSANKEPRVI